VSPPIPSRVTILLLAANLHRDVDGDGSSVTFEGVSGYVSSRETSMHETGGDWVAWGPQGRVPVREGVHWIRITTPLGTLPRQAFWSPKRGCWRDLDDTIDYENIDPRVEILAWLESPDLESTRAG
jgi:hypothetical protein